MNCIQWFDWGSVKEFIYLRVTFENLSVELTDIFGFTYATEDRYKWAQYYDFAKMFDKNIKFISSAYSKCDFWVYRDCAVKESSVIYKGYNNYYIRENPKIVDRLNLVDSGGILYIYHTNKSYNSLFDNYDNSGIKFIQTHSLKYGDVDYYITELNILNYTNKRGIVIKF